VGRKADQIHPFTQTPPAYLPGTFSDARNEHGMGIEAQAGTMLLRYLQTMGGRYRLSVIAGMLAERYPFHKQTLAFFQGAAQLLATQGRLVVEGDVVMSPIAKLSGDMQSRLVKGWLRHAP